MWKVVFFLPQPPFISQILPLEHQTMVFPTSRRKIGVIVKGFIYYFKARDISLLTHCGEYNIKELHSFERLPAMSVYGIIRYW